MECRNLGILNQAPGLVAVPRYRNNVEVAIIFFLSRSSLSRFLAFHVVRQLISRPLPIMATPAIPISTAPQSNKLQRIYPAGARSKPAGARPTPNKTQFPLRKLLAVPKRLLFPPPTTSVGHVRSFGSTSLSNIKLEEVLASKYLAPLSLRDFEVSVQISLLYRLLISLVFRAIWVLCSLTTRLSLLNGRIAVFREYSAENLYFLLWLNEYTKEWEAYKADSSHLHHTLASTLTHDPNEGAARHLPDHLAASLEKGLAVFFTPNGPLELNLSANTRECVLNSAGRSGDPADFQDARSQVEAGLNRSLLVQSVLVSSS